MDIATFGCILLHLRDPLNPGQHGKTSARNPHHYRARRSGTLSSSPFAQSIADIHGPIVLETSPETFSMEFMPNFRTCFPPVDWWRFRRNCCASLSSVLGV